jgi:hypothetical protein
MQLSKYKLMKKTKTAGSVYYDIKDHNLAKQKFTTITEELRKRYHGLFIKMLRENAIAIADFITNMNTEINLSLNHKVNFIEVLNALSRFNGNKKAFREMNRENILSFLDSVRKPEITDPQHKWIGTYNLYRVLIVKFFKWLYYRICIQ